MTIYELDAVIPDWEHRRIIRNGITLFDSTVSADWPFDLLVYRVVSIRPITVNRNKKTYNVLEIQVL